MTPSDASIAQRTSWLAILAHAPRDELEMRTADAIEGHAFEWLRPPETGLAMVRARIANEGDRFNVGEVTMTRCVARVEVQGVVTAGVGYTLGRDDERARWVAQLDALLQHASLRDELLRCIVEPLREARAREVADEATLHATSRVAFYTLQPEPGA
ncbi:MAG TPA: phosphonate C-P lyase system protein PhnG [Burkholderiaceae bacterium]